MRVSALSLGTATFGGTNDYLGDWGATGVKEATRLIDVSLDAGVNIFDTAESYSNGLAEEILGKAIKGKRNRLLISTKATFGIGGTGPNDMGSSRHYLTQACEGCLKRLGIETIDLWQMHAFDAATPVEETVRVLDDLVRAGKVRYVGCSNFSGWHLMKSLAVQDRHGYARYVAHQAYYSLIGRDYEWELMPLAIDQKVGTVVWSPLAGGLLTGKVSRKRPAPKGSRIAAQGAMDPGTDYELLYKIVDALEAVAAETGHSVPQVTVAWTLQRPTVATAVVGARNEKLLHETLQAADFRLTTEQIARLDAASAKPPAYPYWHQRDSFLERNPPPVP